MKMRVKVNRLHDQLQAMTMLFGKADSVTCDQCGRELKTPLVNLPRLLRVGCPQCGNHRFTYHGMPMDLGGRLVMELPGTRIA